MLRCEVVVAKETFGPCEAEPEGSPGGEETIRWRSFILVPCEIVIYRSSAHRTSQLSHRGMRAPASLGAVLLLLVASRQAAAQGAPIEEKTPVLGSNTQCRYAPTATHDFCGLPVSLANFQGAPSLLLKEPQFCESMSCN